MVTIGKFMKQLSPMVPSLSVKEVGAWKNGQLKMGGGASFDQSVQLTNEAFHGGLLGYDCLAVGSHKG